MNFAKTHLNAKFEPTQKRLLKDDDIDIEEEIDLDDPVVADDDQLVGIALLHDQYLTNSDSDRDQPDEDDDGCFAFEL